MRHLKCLLSTLPSHLFVCTLEWPPSPPTASSQASQHNNTMQQQQQQALVLTKSTLPGFKPSHLELKMLYPIGKIKLISAGEPIKKLELWGEQPGDSKGHVRFTDICIVLDWDVIAYLDEDGCEIQISAHDRGPLKGLTTDAFKPDQELVVVGRKDTVPKRALDAIMMSHLTPIGNCGTSSYLLKEDENFKKLFAMREQVQSYLSEMDEILERLSKVRIK